MEEMTQEEKECLEALTAIAFLIEKQTDIAKCEDNTMFTFKLFLRRNKKGQYQFALPTLDLGVSVENGDLERLKKARIFQFVDIGKDNGR